MYTSRIILSRAIEAIEKVLLEGYRTGRAAAGVVRSPDTAGFFCAEVVRVEGCVDLAAGRAWEGRVVVVACAST